MKLNQENISHICKGFQDMQSNSDLLALINHVNMLYHTKGSKKSNKKNQNITSFKLNQLTYHAYHNKQPRYTAFIIKKKNGNDRKILAPLKTLKRIQKCLNVILECVFNPHIAAHGFITQRSIVTNARVHTGQNYVYNTDLKDFFFSIDQARIWACLKNPPFNLKENRLELANLITALCCESIEVERKDESGEWIKVVKSVLPQGAPTSPILTNIVAQRLDFQLTKLAQRFNLKYTRYADDLTFSSMHHVYKKESEFTLSLRAIIKEQNFYINESKVRLQQNGFQRQEVTGLIVNEKVNIKRYYIKDIRRWLYLWEQYGYNKTKAFFSNHYKATRSNSSGEPNLINVLDGKLEYLKMVIGYDDNRFKQLNKRFNDLCDKTFPPSVSKCEKVGKVEADSSLASLTVSKPVFKEIDIDLSKHKPKDVTRFLSLFAFGELKWLTHKFESEGVIFDREQLIKNALDEFNKNTRIFVIPQSLYARILAFITGKTDKGQPKPWNVQGLPHSFYWQSDEMKEWCEKNPGQQPVLSEEFSPIINIFKDSIRVKHTLGDMIKKAATANLGTHYTDYNIDYSPDLNEVDFYTDVEKLRIGLGYIFGNIKQESLGINNSIKIEFIKSRGFRKIRIIHVGSVSKKVLDKRELFKGALTHVETNFYQICDWSIIAENPESDVCNKINILFDVNSDTPVKEKTVQEIEGFTHELTFYI